MRVVTTCALVAAIVSSALADPPAISDIVVSGLAAGMMLRLLRRDEDPVFLVARVFPPLLFSDGVLRSSSLVVPGPATGVLRGLAG